MDSRTQAWPCLAVVESSELEKWREWVDIDDFDGRQKLKEAREALASGEKEDAVMTTVARLRGWV